MTIYCAPEWEKSFTVKQTERYILKTEVSSFNFLHWNDVSRTSKIFGTKFQYFLSFKYN